MHEIKIEGSKVIGIHNAISALQAWLRPGLLSFIVSEHVDAVRPHAIRLYQERDNLLNECAMMYPDVYSDNEPNESLRGKPHPMRGQRVVQINSLGQEVTLFKSPEAGEDYRAREAALFGVDVVIRVSMRITLELIRSIDKERLETPRPLNGMAPTENVVDFVALMPLIDRGYSPDGVASSVPSTPVTLVKEN